MDLEYLFNSTADRYADVGFTVHWLVIAIAAAVTLVGILLTLAVGVALYKDPILYRSFAILCLWQAVVDGSVLLYHFFVTIPAFAIREPVLDLRPLITSTFVGSLFFTELGLIAVIALSRYLGITRPSLYSQLFTDSHCRKLVALCFAYGGICAIYMGLCPWWFDVTHYLIAYDRARPCGNIVNALVIIHATPVMTFGLVCTYMSIRSLRKWDLCISSYEQRQRRSKKERKRQKQKSILMQSAYNCLFQVSMMTLFNVISPILAYFDLRVVILFTNTLSWSLAHMFNSFIVFLFNKSIRNYILCRKTKVEQQVRLLKQAEEETSTTAGQFYDTVIIASNLP